jgi:hypothetical protein
MESNQEKILAEIKAKGPVLPAQIARLLHTNILLASAQLSELVDDKKIFYSHTKFGGSPVYYLKGQEPKLQELYSNLNDKEKQAFDELKARKILKDAALTPLLRVALRNIKDFAVPVNVNHNGQTELYWKWYLLSNEEAGTIIKSAHETQQQIQEKTKELQKQKELETLKQEEKARLEQEKIKQQELERQKQEKEKARLEQEKRKQQELEKEKQEKRKQQELERKRQEEQKKEEEQLKQEKLRVAQEKKKLEIEKRKLEQERKLQAERQQQQLIKEKPKPSPEIPKEADPFFQQIQAYLNKKNIQIIDYAVIKKKKEINLTVSIPSAIGAIEYFCIAKKKRKISDSDLNAVFVQSQLKKKPALFLTTGILSKKAASKLTGELREIIINKLE